MFKTLVITAAVAMLAACGSEVSQDIVDQNQVISRSNAQKNADGWLAQTYPEGTVDSKIKERPMRVVMDSDSTISKSCRYGDGWTSGSVQFPSGAQFKLKCQTTGTGKGVSGCMTDAQFQSKDYKNEDGKCQSLESLPKFK